MHKTALADLDSRGHAVLHAFDVSNAHNEFERADAFDANKELVPDLIPWIGAELGTESVHLYVGPSGAPLQLIKDRGGDQGDPMTGLLYPIVYHKAVLSAESASRAIDPEARIYAYQDDANIVELPGACGASSEAFAQACKQIGLRPNVTKETISPGRLVDVALLPAGMTVVQQASVLKHGGLTEIPVFPTDSATPGTIFAEDGVEVRPLTSTPEAIQAHQ